MSGPRFRTFAKSALILSLLVLAGCATPAPYAPMAPGQATGYTDRQLSDNRWRVTFTGNSVTPRETVENSLLLRAAEVTLASGHSYFVFDTRDTKAQTRYNAFPVGPPYGYGFHRGFGYGFGYGYGPGYWGFHPAWGYSAFGPDVDIVSTTKYESYAEIVVLNDEQAQREPRAVDARAVIARMPPPPPAPKA
ncbi:MAG: hypothetical protein J0I19_00430 [Alphaproteobacteria bacterium]|nr:hypothetical protein [Alphaproteobacteria bacterium]